jgi:hypothetical protein
LARGIVVQNFVDQPFESVVVHDRQNTEWAVV